MSLSNENTIVRIFSDIDQGMSEEIIADGRVIAGGQKGVKARDLATMNIISQIFCYLFGTTLRLQGKTYIIGIKSALQFLHRNEIRPQDTGSEEITNALKEHYKSQKISAAKVCFYENPHTLNISSHSLRFVLKNLGLTAVDSIVEQLSPVNGFVYTEKSKFFEIIKPYKDQLVSKEPFIELHDWLKKAMAFDSLEDPLRVRDGILSPLPSRPTITSTTAIISTNTSSTPTISSSYSIPAHNTSPIRIPASTTALEPLTSDSPLSDEEENQHRVSGDISSLSSSNPTISSSRAVIPTNTFITPPVSSSHSTPPESLSPIRIPASTTALEPFTPDGPLSDEEDFLPLDELLKPRQTNQRQQHRAILTLPSRLSIYTADSPSILEEDSPLSTIPSHISIEAAKRAPPQRRYGTASRSTLCIENPWSGRPNAKRSNLNDHDLQKLAESLRIPDALRVFRILRKDTEETIWRQLSILELATETNYGKEGSGVAKSDYLEAIADCFVVLPKDRMYYIFSYLQSHVDTRISEIGLLYTQLVAILGGLIR